MARKTRKNRVRNNFKESNTQFLESANTDQTMKWHYEDKLTELAVTMFDWKGFPDTINERYLEMLLFTDGKAIVYQDEVIGLVVMKVVGEGDLNIYGEPDKRSAISNNGYTKSGLTNENSVIIYNNFLHKGSMLDMYMYAERLWQIDATIDVNIRAQKTPVLITCNENERLSMKNLYMNYDGFAPAIFGTPNLRPDSIKAISTGAPYLANDLLETKNEIWNQALTDLGIDNVNFQKKERMISDEVNRSSGGIAASRYSRLAMRQTAADQINKMFGLNVTCKFREELSMNQEEDIEEQESEEQIDE